MSQTMGGGYGAPCSGNALETQKEADKQKPALFYITI
jgi:hypothetical protein